VPCRSWTWCAKRRSSPTRRACWSPGRAVVVPGTRPAAGAFASAKGIGLYAPVIVKYRDAKTDAAAALEQALR
jgi:hypothetical protein